MTYLVGFDGGDRSAAALRRAASLADETGAALVAASVLPTDEALAASYDLLEDGDYDPEAAADRLETAAADIAPAASFRSERVDAYAGRGRIAGRLAAVAGDVDADVVVLGGDGSDGGRVVRTLLDVDASGEFDVLVVRR